MNFKNTNSRILVILAFLLTQVLLSQAVTIKSVSEVKTIPVNLRCDYRVNPLGIENQKPNLSWQTSTSENNWLQSAYQIIVSTSPELLTEKKCDIWNSGKILGSESVCISYEGLKVDSQMRYYWRVKVWDENGNPSTWSEPAYWEMGILNHNEWSAKWIARIDNNNTSDRENIRWIWLPDQDATNVPQNTVASFRVHVNLKELPKIATVQSVARGGYQLFINGEFVDGKDKSWQMFERQDILGYLKSGENTIEVKVSSAQNASFNQNTGRPLSGNYAAFAAVLKIEDKDGTAREFPTSGGIWMSKSQNEKEWKIAKVVGELNDPKFGLDPGPLSQPASLFRKEFKLKKSIKSARLYVSALGSYRMFLNGKRLGDNVLTPEFTDYNSRITYQVYDITASLNKGVNVVGSLLGDGWYGSPLGWNGEHDLFGSSPNMILGEIQVEYKDGTKEKIVTDGSWKADRSPVLKSEIYSGEFYDARLEQDGWNTAGFNDKQWSYVSVVEGNFKLLSPQVNNPVKVNQTVKPVEMYQTGDRRWIFDMGQNLVGWARLKVKGEAGTIVKMRFAEKLSSSDSLYIDNLRNATATDSYVLKGKGDEIFTPHFTFHGFRFIELSGYPGQPAEDAIVAEVINSLENPTGFIQTSNPLINKMYDLGIWGQRGNFISVPTDCPQRDERLGYTGDGQVFWRTGTYNFDIAAFTHKWMKDITDEQTVDGGFPNTAPAVPKSNRKNGAPGWEDAGVIVPWGSWMQYGDKSIIQENWPAMVRYMDYVEKRSQSYVRPGSFLGDWLAPDTSTPNKLISTGFWGMTADMMSQMANAIGKVEEAGKYSALKKKIQKAFQKEFIAPDGKIGSGSQTSYIIALHTGMVPDSLKESTTEKLVKAIERSDWHLSTGFLGTPYLLSVLSENGRADVAYRLLLNDTYPSWGYMIKNGATTWWERWNSDKGDPAMNSYNHYAFGSVVEWIYRSLAGINTDPEAPGFKKIIISPVFDKSGKITQAKGEYQSVYGEISSEWVVQTDKTISLKVKIPANTTAKIKAPENVSIRTVNGEKVSDSNKTSIEVGSGNYEFTLYY
jgi:alpha-L-rhamnosidase